MNDSQKKGFREYAAALQDALRAETGLILGLDDLHAKIESGDAKAASEEIARLEKFVRGNFGLD